MRVRRARLLLFAILFVVLLVIAFSTMYLQTFPQKVSVGIFGNFSHMIDTNITSNPYYNWSNYSSQMCCDESPCFGWAYKSYYNDKPVIVVEGNIQKKIFIPSNLSDYELCAYVQSFCNKNLSDMSCQNGVSIGLGNSNMRRIMTPGTSPDVYYLNCGPGAVGGGFAWGGTLCLNVSSYVGQDIYFRIGSQMSFYIYNVTLGGEPFKEFTLKPFEEFTSAIKTTEQRRIKTNWNIDEELVKRIESESIKRNISISDIVERALAEFLSKQGFSTPGY